MKLIYLILAAGTALAQTTRYPDALDSDSSLFVVADNIQTTLNLAMAVGDNVAIVKSGTGFTANQIATICDTTVAVTTTTSKCSAWEHMLITAVNGQSLTVTRAFAGTSARTHANGAVVSVLIDSVHQTVLKAAVKAIETALGSGTSAGSLTVNSTGTSFNYGVDSGLQLLRSTTNSPGPTVLQTALWTQLDTSGAALTAHAFQGRLRASNQTSNQGSVAVAGYADVMAGSTGEFIGVHGDCGVQWAASSAGLTCVGVNAEGSSNVGGGAGIVGLIGLESNMNTGSPSNAPVTVLGAQIQMNNANNNMSANSSGVLIQATSGTSPRGLYVVDPVGGGNFTNPVVIESKLNPVTSIALLSTLVGLADAPNSIGFYRGALDAAHNIAAIQADIAGGFSDGIMHLKTSTGSSLRDVVTLDNTRNLNLFGHLAQNSGNSDVAGTITLSAATSQSFTFGIPFLTQPSCTITPSSNLGTTSYWATVSTTVLTVHTSVSTSAFFNYLCIGNPN